MSPIPVIALAATLLGAAPVPHLAGDTPPPAERVQTSLEVVVQGADGQPLRGAVVRVGNRPEATADSLGRARIAAVAAGEHRVTVTHPALGTRSVTVTLPADAGSLELRPGATGDALAATVRRAVAVAGVTATVQRNPVLDQLGFYQRMETTSGQFATEEQIQQRRAGRLTDVLRRMKGVRVIRFNPRITPAVGDRSGQDMEGHVRIASTRGSVGISRAQPCWMDVFMDGVHVQSSQNLDSAVNLDQVPLSNVIGMEVYHPSEVPTEYRGTSTSACGVVLLWTKRS